MALELDSVEARRVSKVFGHVAALRRVDLRLEPGQCTVVVGPNGAGKSTLLMLLASLSRPSTGEVLYGGRPAKELGAPLRGAIGLAAEQPHGYGELTARENLLFRARLHRVAAPAERVEALLGDLGLGGIADRPMGGYSQGERRRVGLAGALVGDPRLLLLDEPSSGLDGAGASRLVELVQGRLDQGAIVAVTTHDPWLAAEVGGRVVALEGGAVRRDEGAPEGEAAWRELLSGGAGDP